MKKFIMTTLSIITLITLASCDLGQEVSNARDSAGKIIGKIK